MQLLSCGTLKHSKQVVSYQDPFSYFRQGPNWTCLGCNISRTRTDVWVNWWRSVKALGKAKFTDKECWQCDLDLNSRGVEEDWVTVVCQVQMGEIPCGNWDGNVHKKMPGSTGLELDSAVKDFNSIVVLLYGRLGHPCSLRCPFTCAHAPAHTDC